MQSWDEEGFLKSIKKIIDTFDCLKFKDFSSSKVTIKKMKRQAMHWKKIVTANG